MKVQIREYVTKEIDVDFPFYYRHDISGDNYDCVIYGRIEESGFECSIKRNESYIQNTTSYEIERDQHSDFSYCKSTHASTKEKFEQVKKEALEFLQGI